MFIAVLHRLPYSKKNIIDDLLLAAITQLSGKYRINIMELRSSGHNAFESYFSMTYGHGYNNPIRYKRKVTMDVKGAPDSNKDVQDSVHYFTGDLLSNDTYPDTRTCPVTPPLNQVKMLKGPSAGFRAEPAMAQPPILFN
jgi:hypothetical protein